MKILIRKLYPNDDSTSIIFKYIEVYIKKILLSFEYDFTDKFINKIKIQFPIINHKFNQSITYTSDYININKYKGLSFISIQYEPMEICSTRYFINVSLITRYGLCDNYFFLNILNLFFKYKIMINYFTRLKIFLTLEKKYYDKYIYDFPNIFIINTYKNINRLRLYKLMNYIFCVIYN